MTPRVAVFRPDDDRLERAVSLLRDLGVTPVADPMLAIDPTGATPRADAAFVVFTSRTGIDLLPVDWEPGDAVVCAIGERTAAALRDAGHPVDVVPDTYSSRGLVDALRDRVPGRRVEVARSDHGSDVLPEGLDDAGAYHHETVLYRLVRPGDAGESASLAADSGLDAALFTSSLTVEHFLAAAADRGCRDDAVSGLREAVVGAIGEPTRDTLRDEGIPGAVVPDTATFDALARVVMDRLDAGE